MSFLKKIKEYGNDLIMLLEMMSNSLFGQRKPGYF